eukprot:gnl/MRDRNA2_/MRDRNA2_35605_c0_seq1.p1 gnl/MRDRNA2_/MRDRNA2_35605_c0~~gnl/MRDRNA2_/MRDRNA2_35605_c0_seq1.p1  ORF type:complete len:487 (-),score=63.41 gnl/MRDRNA2_/MRDRNA2_35605_c0_seq1:297-1757(-)
MEKENDSQHGVSKIHYLRSMSWGAKVEQSIETSIRERDEKSCVRLVWNSLKSIDQFQQPAEPEEIEEHIMKVSEYKFRNLQGLPDTGPPELSRYQKGTIWTLCCSCVIIFCFIFLFVVPISTQFLEAKPMIRPVFQHRIVGANVNVEGELPKLLIQVINNHPNSSNWQRYIDVNVVLRRIMRGKKDEEGGDTEDVVLTVRENIQANPAKCHKPTESSAEGLRVCNIPQLSVKGSFGEKEYRFLQIKINECNPSNYQRACADPEEMARWWEEDMTLNVWMQPLEERWDGGHSIAERLVPVQVEGKEFWESVVYYRFSNTVEIKAEVYFMYNRAEMNDRWLPYQKPKHLSWLTFREVIYREKALKMKPGQTRASMYLRLHSMLQEEDIKYSTLQDVFSDFGGSWEICIICGSVLLGFMFRTSKIRRKVESVVEDSFKRLSGRNTRKSGQTQEVSDEPKNVTCNESTEVTSDSRLETSVTTFMQTKSNL